MVRPTGAPLSESVKAIILYIFPAPGSLTVYLLWRPAIVALPNTQGLDPQSKQGEHTLFSARYYTLAGIRLQHPPFSQHLAELTHPSHYLPCQLLGSAMRAAGVQAFEYISAPDPERGHCIGLFDLGALRSRQPDNSNQWLCELNTQAVSFKQIATNTLTTFMLSDFLVDGDLPLPA